MDETLHDDPPSCGSWLNCPNPSSHISRWEVAVKVQRPGIDATVAQDIALIRVADLVARTELGQNYEISPYGGTTALKAELDFVREASFTDQLRRNLANSRWFDRSWLWQRLTGI